MEIVGDAQGARSSRHINQPSQRPLLPILGVSKLETKPPAKTDLKREYLNPKASAANLRQYAANTLPKKSGRSRPRPAWRGHEIKSCSAVGKLLLPWAQLANDLLHLKKLASSTRKALKSFWGMIPTNSTARPHHIGLVAKTLRRARNCQTFRRQEQQAHPSAKPATSAANSRHV